MNPMMMGMNPMMFGGMNPMMMGGMGMMPGMYMPPGFPGSPYPVSAYNTGPITSPFMPTSEDSNILGFRTLAAAGIVYGSFDSPPRSIEQPFDAAMSAAIRKGALADLQAEAASIGANGLINVQFTVRENALNGDSMVTHCETRGTAVRVMPTC